jgi:hypothetical protein
MIAVFRELIGPILARGIVTTCDPSARSILSMRLLPKNPVTPALACVGGFLLTGTLLAAVLAMAGANGAALAELPIARVVGFVGNGLLWMGIARAWGGSPTGTGDTEQRHPRG